VFTGGTPFGQFLPAGFRQYLPETATQAAVTVHQSAGLLRPGPALAVLALHAAVALGAATIRMASTGRLTPSQANPLGPGRLPGVLSASSWRHATLLAPREQLRQGQPE
jgi:hypothetical protein